MTWSLVVSLGFIALAVSEVAGSDILTATALPTAPAVPHVTDAQDRVLTGQLSPSAETKSEANALYAEASLLMDQTTGDSPRATELLRRVTTLDPHFAEAQVKLAQLLLEANLRLQAHLQLQTAHAANPGSAEITAFLGYVDHLSGLDDDARKLCINALSHDADQSIAMRVLLELALDQNQLTAGVDQLSAILRAGGPRVSADAWLMLARIYQEDVRALPYPSDQVSSEILLNLYREAAAKTPPETSTLVLLADTYRDLGRRHDALATLHKALALEPSNIDVLLNCADLEIDLHQPTEALRHNETAYALNPTLPGLRETLARLYLTAARFADAVPLLETSVSDFPEDQTLRIDLGIAYDGAKQPDKAKACFSQAFASPICPPEAYLKLAVFQLSKFQVKPAGETLAKARARFPRSAKVRFYQAIQQRAARQYGAALASLEDVRTLAVASESGILNPNYYFECALTMEAAGRQDLIAPMLNEGLTRFPDNPDLMNELAYFWAEQDSHLSRALDLSRHAMALDPDSGAILDTCGWIYFRMGQAKEALPYLQRAALLTNNDPVVLQHLGDTYLKLGRARDAIATWRRALEQAPGNRDLANRIDAAQAQATHAHRSAPGN